jgi:hypothetical protein
VQLKRSFPIVTIAIASLLACGPSQPTAEPEASTTASEPATSEPEPEPEPEPVATTDASEPATSEPEAEVEPEQEPEHTSVTPPVEDPAACQVMLVLEARGDKKLVKRMTLLARAKNLTSTPLELTLRDRCPGGDVEFSGLGHAYDYYRTCTMGACPGGRPPKVIALPPGATVDISSVDVEPDGHAPCNEPLAARKYELTFALPLEGTSNPVVCGPTTLVLRKK